ncbi:autoinducer binding domain-containing protein [Pseudomonas sp. SK3(2021)]|uniref:autoinducer binding domain-containing protein n=1 Tax=Pseudomonas sp. SK3(2021) TaxID=2841064 RepID=UPI00192AEC8D|nr:autoinducer binding domain-containing protein [Pseudomonas sp. SK3(2021)]QQZ41039.1 autoinducer binding domain-containing protein [Pseudomonas sp. SK3(2021)]
MGSNSMSLQWLMDFRLRMMAVSSSVQALNIIEIETQRHGFDVFAFGVKKSTPFTRPDTRLRGTYPEAWMDIYRIRNYAATDPAVEHALRTTNVVVWSDKLREENPLLFSEAKEYGLCEGVTLSNKGSDNTVRFLSFSRSQGVVSEAEVANIGLGFKLMLDILVETLARTKDEALVAESASLTKREKEILQWTADGKSSGEISMILRISENTVNFHLKSIQKKFHAPNKTFAAAYAAAQGLL